MKSHNRKTRHLEQMKSHNRKTRHLEPMTSHNRKTPAICDYDDSLTRSSGASGIISSLVFTVDASNSLSAIFLHGGG